jgi:hypothetical protein
LDLTPRRTRLPLRRVSSSHRARVTSTASGRRWSSNSGATLTARAWATSMRGRITRGAMGHADRRERVERRPHDPSLLTITVPNKDRPWSWPPPTSCFKCFRCFRHMFHVFYLDVAKVYLRCCNDNIRMLQAYISGVSNICFKCFIWMLHTLL